MATLWERIKMVFHSPNLSEHKRDYSSADLDLLCTIFGTAEAKASLLGTVPAENVSPERILKDANAMEMMTRTYPWKIYEQAVWRLLLTALRQSLASDTLERREAARNRVLAHLSDLHLPYELKFEKDRILKMQELTKAAQQKI